MRPFARGNAVADRERLVGYVLTLEEERSIGRAVTSLQAVADRVVVVDSGSTDGTRAIAASLGAEVVVHPFESFSAQRNWALDYVTSTLAPDFVLSLDADEWLTEDLVADLCRRMDFGRLGADVYLLHRRIRFDGRDLRWGGFANTWLPRLFRPGVGRYEDRAVNEHLDLTPEAIIDRLDGHVVNADVGSWEQYIAKHNRYSTLEAQARVHRRSGPTASTTLSDARRRPYLRRRWLRQHVWDRLPCRPGIRFVQTYLLTGGVLDGRAGFHRALFEAWQEMCTDLKAEALAHRDPSC
jgi:glycosyltransferase involved in cell wall biosynthesis